MKRLEVAEKGWVREERKQAGKLKGYYIVF